MHLYCLFLFIKNCMITSCSSIMIALSLLVLSPFVEKSILFRSFFSLFFSTTFSPARFNTFKIEKKLIPEFRIWFEYLGHYLWNQGNYISWWNFIFNVRFIFIINCHVSQQIFEKKSNHAADQRKFQHFLLKISRIFFKMPTRKYVR